MLLLFLSTLFFTWTIAQKSKDIKELKEQLTLKEGQRAENQTLSSSIDALQQQLVRYKTSLALYDSLVPGSERWSKVLTQISHGVEDLNSIWLSDFNAGESSVLHMNGFAVYRTRIPRLSTLFDNSLLKEVDVQAIREQTVYRYQIEVPAPAGGQ